MFRRFIVAIDGPAGSGKSTSAKLVAQKLGFLYIDTGAMYRAITFLAMEKNILNSQNEVSKLAETCVMKLRFVEGKTQIHVDDKDLTKEIRSPEVNAKVSEISKIQGVRQALVQKQREMAAENAGVVMEGRDIGTVVFPNADVKIYLIASLDERSKRRAKEFAEQGKNITVEAVKENLVQRDIIDSTREFAPLTKASDAIEVDTSNITIEEQVEIIVQLINEKLKNYN
ncbi:MAG: (d)CMP kinase [Ignavibacteriaceae bacterium]|nr:(d)CMP kinase [Ignavibacteriaceae bacterium]